MVEIDRLANFNYYYKLFAVADCRRFVKEFLNALNFRLKVGNGFYNYDRWLLNTLFTIANDYRIILFHELPGACILVV